ncbi:MAG: hypothetical protein E7B11_28395 [Clostridiales bacterium]|nr:hypothetical protein [Clostridiales bacterium]
MFAPNSGYIARYVPFIRDRSCSFPILLH